MYPNSQRSFFLTLQHQTWTVIGCLDKYSYDAQGHSNVDPNGHVPPAYEMIRLPSGKFIEGAPEHFGNIVTVVEIGPFGCVTTYIITSDCVLIYSPHEHTLDYMFRAAKELRIAGKIAGDWANHRFAVVDKETDDFAGILFLRGEEWVLATPKNNDLLGFSAIHLVPAEQENSSPRISFVNSRGVIKQYLLDELCVELAPTDVTL